MNIEIRTDGVLHIDGYVNAVERDSREILTKEGRCVERVLPGVFGKALASAEEVRMLLNHRSDRQLASTKDTLILEEDAIGLRATADITDEEVIEKARLGKLKGWSFGFRANDTAMESRANSVPRRILKDISLFEVSVIDDEHNPCYKSTSLNCEFRAEDDIELRTDEKILDEFREQWYNEYYLPRYYRFLEVRFNPYHDTDNGRFTTSAGGGNGWVMYSKGGKSHYQPVNGGNTEADIDEMYEEHNKGKDKKNFFKDRADKASNKSMFGEIQAVSNKYFTFNQVKNDDEFIILTNNVKVLNTKDGRQSPVMLVGNNKAIYIKGHNISPVTTQDGVDTFAVKITRSDFKPYTFKNNFEGFNFESEQNFDNLLDIAKNQNENKVGIHAKGGISRLEAFDKVSR